MDYTIRQIPKEQTYTWLLHKHYAHRIPSITYAFGLYNSDNLLQGVCTYGSPPSPALIQGIFGKQYTDIILELNRLIVNDGLPDNSLSYFVSRTFRLLPNPTVIVSYADSSQGHHGYIYQSLNFIYTGLSAYRTEWKIKGLEHLHSKSISDGETVESMKRKYGDNFYYALRPQKHRYLYFIANRRFKHELLSALKYPILPYPKGDNIKYDSSYNPPLQARLT